MHNLIGVTRTSAFKCKLPSIVLTRNSTQISEPLPSKLSPYSNFLNNSCASEIRNLKESLDSHHKSKISFKTNYSNAQEVKKAAILVPIFLQNQAPSILFTLRNRNLFSHPGEVSFPGGKWDPTDQSLFATALRETEEEIGISSDNIQNIGHLDPLPNKNHTMTVYPYIGFINRDITFSTCSNSSFPNQIKLRLNSEEVEKCFAIPVSELISSNGIVKWDSFRSSQVQIPRFSTPPHISGDIWGLTAYVLYNTLKIWFPFSLPTPTPKS